MLLKPTFAVRALFDATTAVACALEGDDPTGAGRGLRSLVSRETASLPPPCSPPRGDRVDRRERQRLGRRPLFYYSLLGLPGAVAYRVVNTLDAMVGYRTPATRDWEGRARLDDLVNLVPARLTGMLFVLAAPFAGALHGRAAWGCCARPSAAPPALTPGGR